MRSFSTLYRFFEASTRFACWLGAVFLTLMMLVTLADVCARNVLNTPIRGAVEMVEITLVLVVALGLPHVFLTDSNIHVDLVDEFSSKRIVNFLKLFSAILTLALLILFIIFMVSPMRDAFAYSDVKLELNFPVGWLWVVTYVALIHSALAAGWVLLEKAANLFRTDSSE